MVAWVKMVMKVAIKVVIFSTYFINFSFKTCLSVERVIMREMDEVRISGVRS